MTAQELADALKRLTDEMADLRREAAREGIPEEVMGYIRLASGSVREAQERLERIRKGLGT